MNGTPSNVRGTGPFDEIRLWNAQRSEKGWWHSFELPDGTRIDGVCDLPGLRNRIAQFPIASDLSGKRVLDVGTWDGWFAFEMERRGAEVVAVDNWDNPHFREIHSRLGSRVDYRQLDVYAMTPERLGRFDIVLFMGVLYHLKHPLLALDLMCDLATELAAVDSFVLREEHRPGEDVQNRPVMEFYETNELGGQTDNWFGPSLPCLIALCRTAGFARVEVRGVIEHSACLACYRAWLPPPPNATKAPKLLDALHNIDYGINFDTARDDYLSIWFESDVESPALDDVKPQVGGYGVRPIHVAQLMQGQWHANFKLPPGLNAGWHDVTVRVGDSAASNARQIAVDVPLTNDPIQLTAICDSATWAQNALDLTKGNSLSIWIAGLPENADCNNVRVYLDGRQLKITYIEPRQDGGPRQVNVEAPQDAPRATAQVAVAVGEQRSAAVEIQVT